MNQVAMTTILLALTGACCEVGSGTIVKEIRAIEDFSKLNIDGSATLRLVDGPPGLIRVETDDNLIDRIETKSQNGTLDVALNPHGCCLEPTFLSITASTENLASISVDGSADVFFETNHTGDQLDISIDGSATLVSNKLLTFASVDIDIDGSGSVDARFEVGRLSTTIDGSGDLVLRGTAQSHSVNIDGSAIIEAFGLATLRTDVSIDGSASGEVTVVESLTVDIDGSGDVSYCGSPVVSRSIDGSGSVRAADAARCR